MMYSWLLNWLDVMLVYKPAGLNAIRTKIYKKCDFPHEEF